MRRVIVCTFHQILLHCDKIMAGEMGGRCSRHGTKEKFIYLVSLSLIFEAEAASKTQVTFYHIIRHHILRMAEGKEVRTLH
jgi:hypothetical protein